VGARQELPNLEVVRLILKALNKDESLIRHVEDRPGHDRRYAIDPSKLESQLHWSPRTVFDAGLRETIEWYRDNSGWVDHVRSGAYRTYYDQMYGKRRQTLSER
jgi:dTDP-glucose 4,6-dehydratase